MTPFPPDAATRRRMETQPVRDTAPEAALRRALHSVGVRGWRNQRALLPRRTVDIVFPTARVAVNVHGCFWHGCPDHHRPPTHNASWWADKIERNRRRDADTADRLTALGWSVVTVWEHEEPGVAARRVAEQLREATMTTRPRKPIRHTDEERAVLLDKLVAPKGLTAKQQAVFASSLEKKTATPPAPVRIPQEFALACELVPSVGQSFRTAQERTDLSLVVKRAYAWANATGVDPESLDLISTFTNYINHTNPETRTAMTTNGKSTTKARPAKAAAPIVKTGLRFHVDGEPVPDAINFLSEMGVRQMTPRMKSADFKAWLAKQGVKAPLEPGWSVVLPNGRTLSTTVLGGTVEKPAKATPTTKAAKPAAKPTAAPKASKSAEGNGSLKRDKVTPIPKGVVPGLRKATRQAQAKKAAKAS